MNDLIKTGEYTAVSKNFMAPIDPRVAAVNAQVAASPLAAQGISQAPSVITADSLQSVRPFSLPQVTSSTSYGSGLGVTGIAEAQNNSLTELQKIEQAKIDKAQENVNKETATSRSLIEKLMGKGAAQVQAETDAKIPELTKTNTDLINEYNTKELEYRRQEEAVAKEGLLTDVQKNARLKEIGRVKNTELADIAIRQSVALNNLTAAQSLVNRKIDLEYGDLKDLITYQKDFLDNAREDLSAADQRAFDLAIADNERKYNEGVAKAKTLEDTKLKLLQSAASQNAPQSIQAAIQAAKTPEDAIRAAGQYAGDVMAKYKQSLEIQKLEQELNNPTGGILDATTISDEAAPTSSDKNKLVLTSILGSEKVAQGAKTQIANVLGVINSVEELANNRLDGKFTGLYPGSSIVNFFLPDSFKKESTTENEGFLDAINLKVQQWASGASLTSQQIEQVNNLTPTKGDTDAKVRTKLNNLTTFMLTQAQSQLQSQGVNFVPTKVNLFETMSLLEKATPEQLKELRDAGLIQ